VNPEFPALNFKVFWISKEDSIDLVLLIELRRFWIIHITSIQTLTSLIDIRSYQDIDQITF